VAFNEQLSALGNMFHGFRYALFALVWPLSLLPHALMLSG